MPFKPAYAGQKPPEIWQESRENGFRQSDIIDKKGEEYKWFFRNKAVFRSGLVTVQLV